MKRFVTVFTAVALAFALCPASAALAESATPTIDEVKALIEKIYSVDPMTLSAGDTETIADIEAAQDAFAMLSAEDQATLDSTPYDGAGVSKPNKTKPWGRILESAVWSMNLYNAVHGAIGLPDGSYPLGISSESDKGKYNPTTPRTWSVTDVVAKDGKAYGTIVCNETGNYPRMRTGNALFAEDNGKAIVETVNIDGKDQNKTRFIDVPLNLGTTMTFAVESGYAGAVVYQLKTTLDLDVIETQASANTVINAVEALPASVTLANSNAALDAGEAYIKLSDEAKALVPKAIVEKLNAAITTIDTLTKAAKNKYDADKVAKKIKALPKTVTDTDKSKVAAARKAYVALNADAKKLVTNYKTLTAAEKVVKSTKTINKATVTASLVKKAAKKGITTIVLGSKVKTVKAKAFAKAKKVKTLVVKTTKLKKNTVKGSLKSSKVGKVLVPKAKKSAYKKVFTKKVCGKTVSLKTL